MSDVFDQIYSAQLEGIDAAMRVLEQRAQERAQRKAFAASAEQQIVNTIDTLVAGIEWRAQIINELKAYARQLLKENQSYQEHFDAQQQTINDLQMQIRKNTKMG